MTQKSYYWAYILRGKKKKHESKGHMHPNVHCSSIHKSQDMEAT